MSRTTALLALAFAISLAAGAAIASVIDDGEKERVLPDRTETIPILAPSKTVPLPEGATSADAGAALFGDGAAADLPLSEAVAALAPAAVETLREHADDARDAARRYGSLDLSSLLVRFFDEACDEERGERSNPDGTCSTVLSLIAPPPSEILEIVVGPEAVRREHCDTTFEADPGTYPVLIISNNPGEFAITHGPDGGALEPAGDTATGPGEHERWEGWLESDLTPGVDGREVHACQTILARPDADTPWVVHVEGTFDIEDPPATDTAEARFVATTTTPETRRRPPLIVTPLDDNHVRVGVPAPGPGGSSGHVRIGFVDSVGLDPAPLLAAERCARADVTRLREVDSAALSDVDSIPGVDDPASPYDPSYSLYASYRSQALNAGRSYALCVVWLDGDTIVDRASVAVDVPARFHWLVQMSGLVFSSEPRAPSSVTLEVDTLDRILGGSGPPRCLLRPTSSTPVDRLLTPDLEVDGNFCGSDQASASSDIRWHDEFVLRLILRHGDESADFWVTYPRVPCASATAECEGFGRGYTVPVPGTTDGSALFGVYFIPYTLSAPPDWEIGAEVRY